MYKLDWTLSYSPSHFQGNSSVIVCYFRNQEKTTYPQHVFWDICSNVVDLDPAIDIVLYKRNSPFGTYLIVYFSGNVLWRLRG